MTGVRILLWSFLYRDKWHLFWWTLGLTILYWSQAYSVGGLYTSQAEFDTAAAAMDNNAAFIAMAGPARALNTIGGQVTWQSTAFGAILAGLMSMFLIGRHTRGEEESGRDELLRAAPIGRQATTTAALLHAMIANVLAGLGVALSLIAYPLDVPDSIALGVGLTLTGWVFCGTALLAVQLTSSTRSAYGIAGTVIGVAYLLRAVGDIGNGALSWLSPMGWYQAMHAFSGLRWWPALLLVVGTAAGVVAAYVVFLRRDYGAGVVPVRPGPDRASPGLGTGLGLAWRLQRGAFLGWGIGLLLGGLSYGAMGDDVGDIVGDSQASRDLFVQSGDIVEGFYATAVLMLAMIAAGYAISSALRPRGEEDDGRVESLIATALSRRAWLLGHVTVTVLGTVVVVLGGGVGLGAGFALVTGDGEAFGRYALATLAYLAPVLVLAALARLLYGVAPRWASLAWLALVFSFVIMLFGELLQIPQGVQDLSPFEHLALVPAQPFTWTPWLVLMALAAALSAAGQLAFARRDVHG
ncbi:ABC transporter permease [Nocardioides guangzhouensis]|uniref:ABC transporter permease n=1 Tax=Nocardioides guangzhouensis TaxID=2497878 RepID=A0A4V1XZQ0_9ACTN|nr:ABC transporter permease [Nocardioides guangzhouensis]RYP87519.1 ABC transporter permease [Nocardioides guangzhouensis]